MTLSQWLFPGALGLTPCYSQDGCEDQVETYMQSIYTVPGAYNIMLDPPVYTCPIAS